MKHQNSNNRGYTVVEALVAVSLLLMGVAAAASLTLTMSNQEEINARVARAIHWHENAVKLYQLGLTASEIIELMPPLPELVSYQIEVSPADVGASLTLPIATSTLTFSTTPSGDISDADFYRQSEIKAFRVTN